MVGVALAFLLACDTSGSKQPSAAVDLKHRASLELADYLRPRLKPFHLSVSVDGPRLRLFGPGDVKSAASLARALDIGDATWKQLREMEWTWKPELSLATVAQQVASVVEMIEALDTLDHIMKDRW